MAIVLLSVGVFLGFRVMQFARYLKEHPGAAQPGELAFREANREIIAGNGTAVFGNNDEARRLAGTYAKSLKIMRDNFFTKANLDAVGSMEGEFLTYCQLNENSCAFLVHVPELRKFNAEAKKTLSDLAWINAQAVLQTNTKHPPATLAVGVKGLAFYDTILVGNYVADPKLGGDGITARGSGLKDVKLLYPFFTNPLNSAVGETNK